MDHLIIHPHAIEAYERFYPLDQILTDDQIEARVERAVLKGEIIDRQVGLQLVGRPYEKKGVTNPGYFVLHAQRTGLFVIQDAVVVTFLRFYSRMQHDQAVKMYGPGEPVDGRSVPWVNNPSSPSPDPKPERKYRRKSTVWGVHPYEVTFSDSLAKALGGRDEARRKLFQIEAGTLTHVLGREICMTRLNGEVRISFKPSTPTPPRPNVFLPQIQTYASDIQVHGMNGQRDRQALRDQICEGAWTRTEEGWEVQTQDGQIYHLADPGYGWAVFLQPMPPVPDDLLEAAKKLRDAGWKVIRPHEPFSAPEEE